MSADVVENTCIITIVLFSTYLDLWCGLCGGLVPNPTTKLLPVSPRA